MNLCELLSHPGTWGTTGHSDGRSPGSSASGVQSQLLKSTRKPGCLDISSYPGSKAELALGSFQLVSGLDVTEWGYCQFCQ